MRLMLRHRLLQKKYSIGFKKIIRQIPLKINPWVAFGLNNIGYLT